jgi:primosomal protein N''
MRAFVAMRNYITTSTQITAELAEIRAKLQLLERNDEDNLEAINDLSEDMRSEIDNLYQAIAELSLKSVETEKPRAKIGFKTSSASSDDK